MSTIKEGNKVRILKADFKSHKVGDIGTVISTNFNRFSHGDDNYKVLSDGLHYWYSKEEIQLKDYISLLNKVLYFFRLI